MRDSLPTTPTPVPTLDEVAEDPMRATGLTPATIHLRRADPTRHDLSHRLHNS
jgi:hypothetical protein